MFVCFFSLTERPFRNIRLKNCFPRRNETIHLNLPFMSHYRWQRAPPTMSPATNEISICKSFFNKFAKYRAGIFLNRKSLWKIRYLNNNKFTFYFAVFFTVATWKKKHSHISAPLSQRMLLRCSFNSNNFEQNFVRKGTFLLASIRDWLRWVCRVVSLEIIFTLFSNLRLPETLIFQLGFESWLSLIDNWNVLKKCMPRIRSEVFIFTVLLLI